MRAGHELVEPGVRAGIEPAVPGARTDGQERQAAAAVGVSGA